MLQETCLYVTALSDIILLTHNFSTLAQLMSKAKHQRLKQNGTFNRAAKHIEDSLFEDKAFFDPADLVQVKYEMLRRVSHDGQSVSATAKAFGFSRPSFYKAKELLEQDGLAGLISKKPGPHGGHKLNEVAVSYLRERLQEDASLDAGALAKLLQEELGISVHRRSVERALQRKKKLFTSK